MNLLEQLCKIPAPSGNESKISEFIVGLIEDYVDSVNIDNLGNVIAQKNGTGEKVTIECGIDEVGVMVTSIEDNGRVRFETVGKVTAKNIINMRVQFANTIGIIRCGKAEAEKAEKLDVVDLYIDIPNALKEAAEKTLNIGDFGAIYGDFYSSGDSLYSNNMSYKVPIYCVVKVIQSLKDTDKNLCFLFSAQKQLGARGARAYLGKYRTDYLISVNSCEAKGELKLGGGTAVLIKDKTFVASERVRNIILNTASENNIDYQLNISNEINSLDMLSVEGEGALCGGIFIPTEYKNCIFEKISKKDVENTQNLLLKTIDIL